MEVGRWRRQSGRAIVSAVLFVKSTVSKASIFVIVLSVMTVSERSFKQIPVMKTINFTLKNYANYD